MKYPIICQELFSVFFRYLLACLRARIDGSFHHTTITAALAMGLQGSTFLRKQHHRVLTGIRFFERLTVNDISRRITASPQLAPYAGQVWGACSFGESAKSQTRKTVKRIVILSPLVRQWLRSQNHKITKKHPLLPPPCGSGGATCFACKKKSYRVVSY